MEKHLHIISLNVPYPVDYGGVYDLFYKLPALHQQGIQVHLHCFDYGRGEQTELNKFCASVDYYKRSGYQLFSSLPYIVESRRNETLFQKLLQDDHPILMEGIHCTALLKDDRFANRRCFVRLHNVEFEYYHDLKKATASPVKKLYYARESRLLKSFEKSIANKAGFLAVSKNDIRVYADIFHSQNISYLPLFLPPWKVSMKAGMGAYCLYQGDLSVAANARMLEWLIKKIFSEIDVSFKIAGKNPSKRIQQLANTYENINLVANPSESMMQELIRNAHINIIPSFSATGIKLKLLNALFNGKHCIVNNNTVEGTGFEHLCHIANTTEHLKGLVAQLYYQPFREDEVQARKIVLEHHFNNEVNAARLVDVIW